MISPGNSLFLAAWGSKKVLKLTHGPLKVVAIIHPREAPLEYTMEGGVHGCHGGSSLLLSLHLEKLSLNCLGSREAFSPDRRSPMLWGGIHWHAAHWGMAAFWAGVGHSPTATLNTLEG